MATKLNIITKQYRSFVNDQVLTADQLNNLIHYFENQDRLTRVCLNGVGIACGFIVSINSNNEIAVTQGCGVTTDGDLIKLQKPVQGETTSKIDFKEVKFTLAREFKDTNVKYEPFLKDEAKDQIKLYELLPDGTAKNADNFEIGSISGLLNMVAVLYLEEFPKQPELCTAIDCDNQGIEEVSRLKVLLCSEVDAAYINTSDSIYTKHSILPAYLKLPDVAVPRVLLTNSNAATQDNLQKAFYMAISENNILTQLKSGISILFEKFADFLNLPSTITDLVIKEMIEKILGFSESEIPDDVQYRFDLLKDLVDTYNEIKELLLQLYSECCPEIKSFPKHLMIGRLTASTNTDPLRHSYYKSPASENDNQNIARINSLITRFFLMLTQYDIAGKEVKITPSKTKVSLGNRSIPYYFKADDNLISNWDYSKTIRLMQKNNLCYDTTPLSNSSHIQKPLIYNIDAFDFFRVEGYLGIPTVTAESQLSDLLIVNGLDFNFIAFDIDQDQNELQYFIDKNYSLEHLAGVPKGGTFILLTKDNFVIADFALNYKYISEDQDRLSRVCLNGVGIFYGFNVSITDSKEIVVSQGFGVTTEGDLIKLQQTDSGEKIDIKDDLLQPSDNKRIRKNSNTVDIQYLKFSFAKEYKNTNIIYGPFIGDKDNAPIKLYELLPDTKIEENIKIFPIGDIAKLETYVALLYLEEYAKQPELCPSTRFNNKGIDGVSKIKVLLCQERDALQICNSDSIYTKQSILQAYRKLPEVAVPRVILTSSNAANQSNIQKSFYTAISANGILNQLESGISILFNEFKGFLNLPGTITSETINQLIKSRLEFTVQAIPDNVQYRYDLLKDLVDTYNEIKGLLLQLEPDCCPDFKSFPKHLMIGSLTTSDEKDTFRHSFYKSPASGNGNQNNARFNSLVKRFFLMLSQFEITGNEVKITPSKTKVSLSNRSIPYYFKVDDNLIENWDYSKTSQLMQKTNLCYFTDKLLSVGHIQNPLSYNLDPYDFFRIEGHLGKSARTAESQLSAGWSSNGLDFNFLVFDIDKDQAELQYFINKNNSLEHLAGVPKSGTFILLKKADNVIADYALGYKYVAEKSDDCCKIQECSYPWISSLRYLNNLSRSLDGTQSKTKQMPKYYRLYVLKYSINDIDLITQPVEIRIPLREVFSRRLHVVIEKLNEQFPIGLVFDFDQLKKQLKIKKLKDDTFILHVKDITLSNNSPLFTYTEMGFLRNGKMLNSKDIICTDVKMHNRNFYQKLHDKYNPKNKDDDFGSYNDKWSKWHNLADKLKSNPLFTEFNVKRFGNKLANLPQDIQTELNQIKADILQNNNPKAKVYLSGDWANGTWVDSKMLAHYQANLKNTHDDIVLFMKLRETLHQKLGKSKFDIFIANVTEAQLKALQTKYINKANFYLGKAEEKKYIEL